MEAFTYEDFGALLVAIGHAMYERGLCASAAQDGLSDNQIRETLINELGYEFDRATELMTIPVEQAIGHLEHVPSLARST